MPARSSAAARAISLLVACYPPSFRHRFADGMRDALARDHARARAAGRAAVAAFWVRDGMDALAGGLVERWRRRRKGASMASFFSVDLRGALRSLRATPVVTAVAVLSLALGIGANAALFSILNGLVLKTLPVRAPAQLVVIDDGSWTNPIWEQIRDRSHVVFDDAFAWSATRFDLSSHGETDFVDGAWASGRMFQVLGVPAAIGRTFTEADDARDGGPDGPVAVISDRFWHTRFAGAADVIGRHLTVNGLSVSVIGVAPAGFFGPDVGRSADVILPINVRALMPNGPKVLDGRSTWWLEIMGRLRPGQTIGEATAALNGVRPQIRAATMPQNWNAKDQAEYLATPLALIPAATGESELRASYSTPLEIVLVVVGAVLLIACANLASLLLARAAARRRELSVRLALGASRFRLAKLLLTESALLAIAGAGLGLVVARFSSALLLAQLGTGSSGATVDVSLDWRVLAFTVAVAGVTALVFGLAPALGVSRVSPHEAMKEESRSVTGERRFGVRNALVVGQVALSLTLLVGAALFVRTLTSLVTAQIGFTPGRLVAAEINASAITADRDARLALYERLRSTEAALPGVESAAISVLTPVGHMRWNTEIEQPPGSPSMTDRQRLSEVNFVSPGWFRTFGVRLVAGRDFGADDTLGAEHVAIVSQTFARMFFPGRDAVGQTFRTGLEGPTVNEFRIVGIASDTVYQSVRKGFEPIVYAPLNQLDAMQSSVVVVARASGGPASALVHVVSAALAGADSRISFTVRPVAVDLDTSFRQERLVAMLAGFFGGLALLLAAIGLYGVTSHAVSRRRAEIGIRMALGANPRNVVRLVLGRLGWLLAIGVIVGLGLSWWASHFVSTLLFGLGPHDPITLASAAAVLAGVGIAAGWLPARRASRLDPVVVLRET